MATIYRHPNNPGIRCCDLEGDRCYVHKTNIKTYIVTTCYSYSLDDMVELAGEYHFRTLKDLRAAIESHSSKLEVKA